MNIIPATCVDDFYSDPDRVREFALAQSYYPSDGGYPGTRSDEIQNLDNTFFEEFCNKVFSLFIDPSSVKKYRVKTQFQLIDKFDNDANSPKNKGWVHFDDHCILAGIIYLNPDADPSTGTSIFKLVDHTTLEKSSAKQDFFSGKLVPDYDNIVSRHNSSYVETIRYNNIYNRLICFDSSQAHGVNSYYTSGEPRLTQVFFLGEFEASMDPPIIRHQKFL
jgi:hypothetical protein